MATATRPGPTEPDWTEPPPRRIAAPRGWVLLVALLAQLLLGAAATELGQLAALHALCLTAVTVYVLLRRDVLLSLCILAYLPGSEILWRQGRGGIPWQWGFYVGIGVALFFLVLVKGSTDRNGKLAFGALVLLVPSSVLTIAASSADAREFLSFALAGPILLIVATAFLSGLRIAPWLYRRMLWVLLAGIMAPLGFALATFSDYLINADSVDFSSQSNFATSGGFGPVQVSSVFGLGVLAAILLILAERALAPRVLAAIAGTAVGVQSLLTFSRGGMLSVAFAVAGLSLALATDRRARRRIWSLVAVILVVGTFVIVPRIDAYTEGAFNERFSDLDTGRTDIAASDIETFQRNPLFGVGPGMTKFQRLGFDVCELRNDQCEGESSSHTEFTRVMSEHGVLGIGAMALIIAIGVRLIARRGIDRALPATLIVWAFAQMAYANLRISAVPIAFALAALRIGDPPEDDTVADVAPAAAPTGGRPPR